MGEPDINPATLSQFDDHAIARPEVFKNAIPDLERHDFHLTSGMSEAGLTLCLLASAKSSIRPMVSSSSR